MSKKVLFLVNHDVVIFNFRRELVEELLKRRYEVTISCPRGPHIQDLEKLGCSCLDIDIDRHGVNPLRELQLYSKYRKLMKQIQPDIVLTYTIKPNLYGSLAASSLHIPYIANITGLGGAMTSGGLMSVFLYTMYRLSMRKVQRIFFQNQENRNAFLSRGIGMGKDELIPGSGVNLQQFRFADYPISNEPIMFTFIGRLMKDKGINEFIRAAEIVKKSYESVEFRCIGFVDDSDKIMLSKLHQHCKYIGFTSDVRPFVEQSHAVVLPSYHEGMSNVLLEAAAMGRPVIASKVPGCKETFEEGISGLGCEARDAESLALAMINFIELPHEKKREMGVAGRKKMEREFDRHIIVDAYLREINKIR